MTNQKLLFSGVFCGYLLAGEYNGYGLAHKVKQKSTDYIAASEAYPLLM
jgi:hypothetical protein